MDITKGAYKWKEINWESKVHEVEEGSSTIWMSHLLLQ